MRRCGKFAVLGLLLTILGSCGYRLAGGRTEDGSGRSMAVPTFANRTTTYRIEQDISEALRRELIRRTRYTVHSDNTGDLVVTGEVIGYAAIPVLFTEQGRATAYTVSVDLRVLITDTRTGSVLFQNDRWTFRELFELAQNSSEFVPEEPAAVDRLARRFAASLVAEFLNKTP